MRPYLSLLMVLPALASAAGCANTQGARYVYQDREFGVVGIPANTDRWPTRYRTQAEGLMHRHFPEGHEIVRAEEVVEGSRILTTEGTNTAELAPTLPIELLKIAKLGRVAKRTQADTVKVKECRIVYRRALRPAAPDAEADAGCGFADAPATNPTAYIDPNAEVRTKAADPEVARTGAESKPKPEKDDKETQG
jgi:hypothetical protein